ncbi:VOC family protein [Kitasatospora sp. NBC_01539]|uniref:VOC family protein n=1 Tax=Kitasatospora sp. NBC_01539 TaxID=2903577 RepID=UPI0038600E11
MKIDRPAIGAPCWVELATVEPDASKVFYRELFAWRTETDLRPEAGGYTALMLGAEPVAGLSPLRTSGQPTTWTVSFAVPDADAAAQAVRAAGGRILAEPVEVLDLGRFAVAADPGGAAFALWQARAFNGTTLIDEPGSLGWVELATRDTAAAKEFYPRVLGWSVTVGEMYTQWGLPGRDFGGMTDMADQFPADAAPYWMPYFAVADVDTTAERAAVLGATVVLPPTDVPDGPRLAVLRDPQGAVLGIHVAGTVAEPVGKP